MRKTKRNDGQVIVEFAMMLPILLLILGGIIEFGIIFYNKQVLTNASREAARAGIVDLLEEDGSVYEPDLQAIVDVYCKDRLITFGEYEPPSTVPSADPTTLFYPANLTVTVNYQYKFILSGILNMFGSNLGPQMQLSATTVMKME